MLELYGGETLLWRHIFPEKPAWGKNWSEPFAFDNPKGPGDVQFVKEKRPILRNMTIDIWGQ
jgi:hypothetical protein